jgi:hypothetical protein
MSFVSDPQAREEMRRRAMSLAQSGARGFTTGVLGGPVDIANVLMAGAGGEQPVGGGEWIGHQLERAGLLAPKAEDTAGSVSEFAGGMVTPGGAAKGGMTFAAMMAGAPKGAKAVAKGVEKAKGAQTMERAAARQQAAAIAQGGKIPGAPPGIDTPEQVNDLVRKYVSNIEGGAIGAPWYDKSSKAVFDLTGRNKKTADKFVSGVSATSATTSVPANWGFAVKGHNQAMAGVPVDTGKYPQQMSKKIEQAYEDPDKYYLGHKTEPFHQQLAVNWAPERVGRGVNDMWEMHAMGYPDDFKIGPAHHAFMDDIRDQAIAIANKEKIGGRDDWTTGRAQAANWVYSKAKAEGTSVEQAAQDFADLVKSKEAVMSRESTPGAATGHRPDILQGSEFARQAYQDAQNKFLLDRQGRDRTLAGVGLLTGKSMDTPGYWKGAVNPSTQSPFLIGQEKGGKGFDKGTQSLAESAAAFNALFGAQEATAGHFVNPSSMRDASVASFDLGRTLTAPEMKTLGQIMDTIGASPVAVHRGVNILGEAGDFGPAMKKVFGPQIEQITGRSAKPEFGTYGATEAERASHGQTGMYVSPDWGGSGPSPATHSMLPYLEATPEIAKMIDAPGYRKIAGQYADLDAPAAGLVNEKLQLLRRAMQEGGLAKVKELAAKGLLPAGLIAALGLSQEEEAPMQ